MSVTPDFLLLRERGETQKNGEFVHMGNGPILCFSGHFRHPDCKKFVKNTKNFVSNFKNSFKFSKRSRDFKAL